MQLIKPPRGHRTLPTKAGSLLIVITIGVGTAAFNTGQNILYLSLALLLSTILVSGILSWLNFKGLRWRLQAGTHARAGQLHPVRLELQNTKRRLPSYALSFLLQTQRSGDRHLLTLRDRIEPQGEGTLEWDWRPQRRGRETLQLSGLVSRYPFGFLKKSISDSVTSEVVIWPARIDYTFTPSLPGWRWASGDRRRKGDGVDLVAVRDYRSGDPLRRIHWKATARIGRLQVRETEQDHHPAYTLWVDPSARVWTDAVLFERLCSFAASLAEDLFRSDQLKRFGIAGHGLWPVDSLEGLHACIDRIATLERTDPVEAAPPAEGVVHFTPGADGIVLARIGDKHAGQA